MALSMHKWFGDTRYHHNTASPSKARASAAAAQLRKQGHNARVWTRKDGPDRLYVVYVVYVNSGSKLDRG